LQEYLNAKRVGLVSKENRRRMLVVLFNFTKAQGWLRSNQETAADALGTYKIKQRNVEIYTLAEIGRLLNAADLDFVPYLALIAFGGVRREELHKGLSWHAINFDRGTIMSRPPSPRRHESERSSCLRICCSGSNCIA